MKKTLSALVLSFALVGCFGQKSVRLEDSKVQKINIPMPSGGEVHHGSHGKETWFAYGALEGVEGNIASGVTQSHYFEDGLYHHTVNLNIEPAKDGYFYEGWIVDGSSVISTGHLSNYFGDARHSMQFEVQEDYRSHLKVIVTLEPDDGNPAPAGHVAQGTLKVTER